MPDRWLQAEPLVPLHARDQADPVRRGADRVERRARLPRRARGPRAVARIRLVALRRLRRAGRRCRRRSRSGTASRPAGLGHDRDLTGGLAAGVAARASRARTSGSTAAARAASCPASRAGSCGDAGEVLPRDGEAVGELEVRGAVGHGGSYYPDDDPEKFRDGWLRTGDVGKLDDARLHHADRPLEGRHQVRRRVDLLGRPGERPDGAPATCVEAAVVAIPDEKWDGAAARLRRAPEGATVDAPRSCASSWPSRGEVAAARRAGRSSRRCRGPRSASSTRRSSASGTPTASSTSSSRPVGNGGLGAGPAPSEYHGIWVSWHIQGRVRAGKRQISLRTSGRAPSENPDTLVFM